MKTSAAPDSDTQALNLACQALWLATLSLMTAFMQAQGPAHRYLLARRIGENFETLRHQECFTTECRGTFLKLSHRWNDKADRLAPRRDSDSDLNQGGLGLFRRFNQVR